MTTGQQILINYMRKKTNGIHSFDVQCTFLHIEKGDA